MMQNEIRRLHLKTVDRYNKEKLYIQLTGIFLEEIRSGNWPGGSQIFTEDTLCRQYSVSKITVRQAINNLVSEGYLIKVQGKGTFVCSVPPAGGLVMKTRLMGDMIGQELQARRQLLFNGLRNPLPYAETYLETSEDIYYILWKGMSGDEPVVIEESFIPVNMLSHLEGLDFEHCSTYDILEERGAKKIFRVEQTIEISEVSGDSALLLELNEGAPTIAVHRLFLSSDNLKVAYTRFLGRCDKYKFQLELERIR